MRFRRNENGVLSEVAPALFLLFCCLFFPCLDLIMLAVKYSVAAQLNYTQTRAAAMSLTYSAKGGAPGGAPQNMPNNLQQVQQLLNNTIASAWAASGLGLFTGAKASDAQATISFAGSKSPPLVTVTTNVTATPFVLVPLGPLHIPGLSGPATFSISDTRPCEYILNVSTYQ